MNVNSLHLILDSSRTGQMDLKCATSSTASNAQNYAGYLNKFSYHKLHLFGSYLDLIHILELDLMNMNCFL